MGDDPEGFGAAMRWQFVARAEGISVLPMRGNSVLRRSTAILRNRSLRLLQLQGKQS